MIRIIIKVSILLFMQPIVTVANDKSGGGFASTENGSLLLVDLEELIGKRDDTYKKILELRASVPKSEWLRTRSSDKFVFEFDPKKLKGFGGTTDSTSSNNTTKTETIHQIDSGIATLIEKLLAQQFSQCKVPDDERCPIPLQELTINGKPLTKETLARVGVVTDTFDPHEGIQTNADINAAILKEKARNWLKSFKEASMNRLTFTHVKKAPATKAKAD